MLIREFDIVIKENEYRDAHHLVEMLSVEDNILTGIFQVKKRYHDYYVDNNENETELRGLIDVKIKAKIDLVYERVICNKLVECIIQDLNTTDPKILDYVKESINNYYDSDNPYFETVWFDVVALIGKDFSEK